MSRSGPDAQVRSVCGRGLPLTPTHGSLIKAALLGAAPGSKWAVYPPGETQFTPGAALGTATVLRLENSDAIAHLDWKAHPFPAGSRAVALMPTKAPDRVPVKLLDMSPQQRAKVTQILSRDIVNLVGPNEPAQFLVDVHGSDVRLLTADGLQVIGQFAEGRPQTADEIGRLLDRSGKAAEILSLDNAATRITVTPESQTGPRYNSAVSPSWPIPNRLPCTSTSLARAVRRATASSLRCARTPTST